MLICYAGWLSCKKDLFRIFEQVNQIPNAFSKGLVPS